ncbi:MAG: lipopolysaccharide biosynthesis protein [Myxococcales bacterium]|nr:lipopolysaccharide biosynthesis protein [Myxococcales bacterium]
MPELAPDWRPWSGRLLDALSGRGMAGSSAWLVASQLANALLGIASTAILARTLGPGDYGLLALVLTFPMVVYSIVSFKPITVATKYLAGFKSSGGSEELGATCKLTYLIDQGTALLSMCIVVALGGYVAGLIGADPEVRSLQLLYAASFPLFSLEGTSMAVLSIWGRFRHSAVLAVVEKGVLLGLVVAVSLGGLGLRGGVAAMALTQAASGLGWFVSAQWVLARNGHSRWWRARLSSVKVLQAELVRVFGWNFMMVSLTGLMAQLPVMLLGRLAGAPEAGFFRLSSSLSTVAGYLEWALFRVAYPDLCARVNEDRESVLPRLRTWTRSAAIPAVVIGVLGVTLIWILIPPVFGDGYREIVHGAQVMVLGVACAAPMFWASPLLYSVGRFDVPAKVYLGYVLATLLLGSWMAMHWGFFGMAFVVGAGRAACGLVMGRWSIQVMLAKSVASAPLDAAHQAASAGPQRSLR